MPENARKRIMDEWENRLPDLVKWIDAHTTRETKAPISPEVVQAVATISLYESSKKIESYSKALKWLTVALVFLTAVLIIRTFLP
jgi:predicted alternative tryptophan synthase beta-subunit